MSRKKTNKKTNQPAGLLQHTTPPTPPPIRAISLSVDDVMQLMGGVRRVPSFEAIEAQFRDCRDAGLIDRHWSVRGEKTYCVDQCRDSVFVISPSPQWRRDLVEKAGADAGYRHIVIAAFDGGDQPDSTTIFLDVEDVKRLVNVLSEAVAHTEQVCAAMARDR